MPRARKGRSAAVIAARRRWVRDALLDGQSVEEIASRLGIPKRTVERDRRSLSREYGAKSAVHLGRLLYEERIHGRPGSGVRSVSTHG